MKRTLTILLAIAFLASCSAPSEFVITIIGTNDVHGQLTQTEERGGLVTVSGYVSAVRDARERDGGGVLLIDAGDMWQGTLESNLSEGAAMVRAYNALGYAAAAIGNHEFDFGPIGPQAIPSSDEDDPVEALKQRATEANFPLLAANLIDANTGIRVDWENVQPSVLVDVNGVKVGIIGVTTSNALQRTIAANVRELRIAPLVPVITEQANKLRKEGATLVIVTAHAGGMCTEFDNPNDLSSCVGTAEIFEVARALPAGLVNHIIAGHVHQGVAHIVNGISITSSYSNTRAFGRVDFSIDRTSGNVINRRVYPPHPVVAGAEYEGQAIQANADVVMIAERARQRAKDQKEAKLGIRLETPFTLSGNPESTLGNLFTDALLAESDVDVVIHNVAGGLRQNLPAGELTFGDVYQLSPFENRLVILTLTGAEIRQIIAEQVQRRIRIGFSGMRVAVACNSTDMAVAMHFTDGREISDSDLVTVAVNDYIALGGDDILTSVIPEGGYVIDDSLPLTRDVFIDWLGDKGGSINAEDFDSTANPKWVRPDDLDPACHLN
jgi:2',3'-cyclic-nucleotide 2'-phosphodiesterase (5'-nucleotidase family)